MNTSYFVVPVFNEAENVSRVLGDLENFQALVRQQGYQSRILIIDDGSNDGTAEMFEKAGRSDLTVVRHPVNKGPGAAFETAFSHLLQNGVRAEDLVITLEGDATSDPQIFPRMMKRLVEGDDLILASPYLYGGGFCQVESFRLFLSHMANGLFKMILGVRGLATFSCFFRIYRGSALLKLKAYCPDAIISSAGFECAAEVILKAVRIGLSISEVPFLVDWSRRRGKSKMKIVKTSMGYFRLFAKFYSWPGNVVPAKLPAPAPIPLPRQETV